ncbi:hypothetical protein F4827_006529 [Paraburkholderia bannensis]|uniref:Uncharacterized protein n=1 Tax=Paraburkholderia bannensis TaxID=765414 RepID=A0A7W9U417_9BURK|nr:MULTISPECIES: hypothetical protein [Paraburkholderia]MBB3261656.1 hypothetical protein [Paraburkholderia sp. WP4_3_2]MBB6106653.1 hypothetical protein [Paraburkholderia bannensis]
MIGEAGFEKGGADSQLLVRCMMSNELGTNLPDVALVHDLILARSLHVERFLADPDVRARIDAPGYLARTLGKRIYNIPYYLTPVFPDDAQLGFLDELVDQVRLGTGNSFCLSGSSTALGRVQAISDIDFCEYFGGSAADLLDSAQKKEMLQLPCVLVTLAIEKSDHNRPFEPCLKQFASDLESDEYYRKIGRIKFDYISTTRNYGPLAVTNVVIPFYGDDDPRLSQSFQFQEAVIHENDTTPKRPLVLPSELGRYLAWLRGEAISYFVSASEAASVEERARCIFKALKRLMSLLLVIDCTEEWELVVDLLNEALTQQIICGYRATEVAKLLDRMPEDTDRSVLASFAASRPLPDFPDIGVASLVEVAYQLAENLLHTIATLSGEINGPE